MLTVFGVKFSSDSYSVAEGEEGDVCLILESGQLSRDALLCVVSQPGSANSGEDYNLQSMFYVTLQSGQNRTRFTVDTMEDKIVEGEETFHLALSSDCGDQAVIPYSDTVTVHVEDDDSESL